METFKNALIFLFNNIINELYPKQCIICGKLYNNEICNKCYKTLEIVAKSEKYKNKSFNEHIYFFKYEGKIRNLIIDYKFNDKAYLSNFFTKIIIKNEKICRKIKSYDIIIPVPIHKKRKNERGYNQSELIAKKIAKNINELELVTDCLIKEKNTVAQSTLTKQQRKQNVKQVYKLENKEKIQNKKIILLDDIYTTGATAEECSKILKRERRKRNISINNSKRRNKLEIWRKTMEDLVESILDYIRADYTDYAIMINGEWGSGKTYFWNHKVRNKIETMELNGKRYKTIYMSLYGISNLEEISKKIFIETTQLMDKNLKKFMGNNGQVTIPEYAKTGLDMANFFGVTQNGDKIDYKEFFSTDDKVLCFDDLERANVDVIDILGYINNFVEHDHIKTIIICNEKELSTKLKNSNLEMKTFIATYLLDKEGSLIKKTDKPMVERIQDTIEYVFDKANDYERIKEKLIGETFEYAPEFNYIINGILMRYEKYPDLIRFLRENTNLIISTFNKSGTRNLRILKHALNDFKKIFDMVNKSYPNTNHRVMQTMLIFTIAISFEIKAGKVTKDKFVNIGSNEEYKAILVSSRVFMDNRQFYIKEFDNNYYYNFKAEYRFFKFIEMYVRTRIFNMKVFKENMEVIINTVDTDKLPGYKRLLTEEYWKISDDQFDSIIEEVLDDVKNGRIKPIEIVKIFAYFAYFIKKELISYDIKTIKSVFINGLNISSLNADYCPNVQEELESISVKDIGTDMEEILKYFDNVNETLKDKMYKEKAEDVFKNIPMKMELFYDKFAKECMTVPIFKYYDVFQMFQRISCASNEDIVTIKEMLEERAKKYTKEIEPEIKNIRKLKQVMDDYIDGKESTIKIVMLEDFSKGLEKILELYKTTPFMNNKKEENNIIV